MIFDTLGHSSANKKGLMLHGMSLNGKAMLSLVENTFGKDYYIIFPTYDGHYKEGKTVYSTISEQADKIIEYFESNGFIELDFIMGVSLGAMTALEILQRKKLKVRKYIFDGLPFADFNVFKRTIMKIMIANIMKKSKKHPKRRGYIEKTFGTSAPYIKEFAMFAEKQDICNVVDQSFSGKVPENLDLKDENVVFVFGSKEDAFPHFKKFQKKYPEGYKLIVKDGYKHGQYFRENIKEYVVDLLK